MIDLFAGIIANVNDMCRFHDMDGDGKAGEKILDNPAPGGSGVTALTERHRLCLDPPRYWGYSLLA